MVQGSCPVRMVQGEAYKYELQIDENVAEFVTAIYISCKTLDFCHALTKNNDTGNWEYSFYENETKEFPKILTTYSVTIHSSIPDLEPQILINQTFEVYENKNKQTCGG